MGASAAIQPSTVSVDPGDDAACEVKVRNTGSIVDQYTLEVVGAPGPWALVEPETLSLFPGAEGVARISFRPPKSPQTPAGPVPFGVRVISKEDPEGSTVEEGTITVGPFIDIFAELVPRTSRGSRTGKHELAVDNRGNIPLQGSLEASDPDAQLLFRFESPSIESAPGTATFVRLRARGKKLFLWGPPQTRPFEVAVTPEGSPPVLVGASMVQESIIPRWAPKALLALGALALAWFLILRPVVKDEARAAVADPLTNMQAQIDAATGGSGGSGTPGGGAGIPGLTTSEPLDGRLDRAVAEGSIAAASIRAPGEGQATLSITDMILENPQGDSGILRIKRGAAVLIEVRLDNFRDLDYHFVTAVLLTAGERLVLEVGCDRAGRAFNECHPAMYFSGFTTAPL